MMECSLLNERCFFGPGFIEKRAGDNASVRLATSSQTYLLNRGKEKIYGTGEGENLVNGGKGKRGKDNALHLHSSM